MNLLEIISDFYSSNMRLADMIRANHGYEEIEEVDRQNQKHLNAIRDFQPTTPQETLEKLRFFVRRLQADIANTSDTFSVEALASMLENDVLLENFGAEKHLDVKDNSTSNIQIDFHDTPVEANPFSGNRLDKPKNKHLLETDQNQRFGNNTKSFIDDYVDAGIQTPPTLLGNTARKHVTEIPRNSTKMACKVNRDR